MKQSVSLPIDGVAREARFSRRERIHFDHIFSPVCTASAANVFRARAASSSANAQTFYLRRRPPHEPLHRLRRAQRALRPAPASGGNCTRRPWATRTTRAPRRPREPRSASFHAGDYTNMLGKAEYYGVVMLVAGRWLRRCFEKERGVLRG